MHDIDIDKLEKLIIRIAIFSVLYTFPGKYKHNPTQYKFNCNPKMHQVLSRLLNYSLFSCTSDWLSILRIVVEGRSFEKIYLLL